MRKMIPALLMCAFLAAGAYTVKPDMPYHQITASEVIQETEIEPEIQPAETVREKDMPWENKDKTMTGSRDDRWYNLFHLLTS